MQMSTNTTTITIKVFYQGQRQDYLKEVPKLNAKMMDLIGCGILFSKYWSLNEDLYYKFSTPELGVFVDESHGMIND